MRKRKGGKESKKTRKTTSKNVPTRNVFVDDEIFEEDGELDPEDLEYFQDSDRSFAFLHQVEAEVTSSGKKRKRKQTADGEREADYEKKPRRAPLEQDHKERALLPIKNKDSVIQRKEKIHKTDHSLQNGGVGSEEQALEVTPVPSAPLLVLSMVELFNQRRQKLIQRKHRIAELSNSILENPESSVSAPLVVSDLTTRPVSELQELCSMCYEKEADIRITTKKLAMVSLLTVFKDVIPGYPIRTASEKEQGVKLSKEVKKLRDYEEGLLKNYQKYLQILEETVQECVKTQKRSSKNGLLDKKTSSESLMLVIVQCMCDLLTSVPHFNFHTNLITVLVPRMNEKSLDGEAVRVISKFVKSKGFRVQPCVLETFLHLRISQIDIQSLKQRSEKKSAVELKIEKNKNRMEKKLKGKISKKERKRKREMKKLEKEMQETEAVESQQKRAKLQTEILKFVFVTYFRVLKTVGHSPLLSPVLEGLAKFAHLISVDFFNDLMGALHTLLDNKELTLRETLNCVLTAFKILSGQGEALNIDPREFYRMLYLSLLRIHAGSSSEDVPVALQCLEEMLKKRRKQVPVQRVAGFVKRLCTVSLQSEANSSMAFLAYVNSFLQSHTKVQALLDGESMGTGVFRPDVNDPELSNADSTTVWELAMLGTGHFHPAVRLVAHHVAEGAPSKGSCSSMMRMSPNDFWIKYDPSEMKLNPDLKESELNRKGMNLKRIKHMEDGEWKNSDMVSAVKEALDFTEASRGLEFSFPVLDAER